MIGISTLLQNTAGAITFETIGQTAVRGAKARVSRVATLDGGAVVNHLGFSDGDRTLRIFARLDETDAGLLWDIFALGLMVNVATNEGMYRAAIDLLTVDDGGISMTILIKESLTS